MVNPSALPSYRMLRCCPRRTSHACRPGGWWWRRGTALLRPILPVPSSATPQVALPAHPSPLVAPQHARMVVPEITRHLPNLMAHWLEPITNALELEAPLAELMDGIRRWAPTQACVCMRACLRACVCVFE
eukprot:153047-Chlamydomonas_euryale.AAC.15